LTTTRVAQRAGVSVGTLYQYYPNKQSLLFAVLENHLTHVMAMVEAACQSACHKPLAEMIREMVEAFVDAKMDRADISVALYQVAADVGGPALIKRINQRSRKTVEEMLETATDIKSSPDKFAIDIMLSAMAGAMRSLLEAGPSPATARKAREQLVLLCRSYMTAATAKRV
jgi:AcrR family transcriptional regulator